MPVLDKYDLVENKNKNNHWIFFANMSTSKYGKSLSREFSHWNVRGKGGGRRVRIIFSPSSSSITFFLIQLSICRPLKGLLPHEEGWKEFSKVHLSGLVRKELIREMEVNSGNSRLWHPVNFACLKYPVSPPHTVRQKNLLFRTDGGRGKFISFFARFETPL